jgi:hypothetical protein
MKRGLVFASNCISIAGLSSQWWIEGDVRRNQFRFIRLRYCRQANDKRHQNKGTDITFHPNTSFATIVAGSVDGLTKSGHFTQNLVRAILDYNSTP